MKYIDAEKLIAKLTKMQFDINAAYRHPQSDNMVRAISLEYDDILSLVDSLQQEPRFPQYDNIVEKVFGAGNLEGWERDEAEMLVALAKEELLKSLQQEQPEPLGYDKALLEVKSKVDEIYEKASIGLNEYDSGLYNGIAETCMKLRGFIKARLGSDELPEVDLGKEITRWLDKGNITDTRFDDYDDADIERTARHFYELGLNIRKEK